VGVVGDRVSVNELINGRIKSGRISGEVEKGAKRKEQRRDEGRKIK
jgi:hypothetical protein